MRQLTHIQHSALLRTSTYAHINHDIRRVAAIILRHDAVYLLLYGLSNRARFAEALATALERSGWERAQVRVDGLEWWADEIWEVASRWSPVGARVFVTLLVDPQWEGPRRKGHGVWAAGCSVLFPTSRTEAESGGTLRTRASSDEIAAFANGLSASRVQVPVDGAV